jgi:hypothetical protein
MKILRLPFPAAAMALPVTSRWPWLWLVIGAVLLPFTSIQPSLAIAAWIAPMFLLRFVRTQRARVALPVLALVQSVALGVNWYIGSTPNTIFALIGVGIGLLATLAYVADRLLTPRLHGFTRILVFPLALTAIDWLGSLLAPALTPFLLPSLLGVAGAWDSPGYTRRVLRHSSNWSPSPACGA